MVHMTFLHGSRGTVQNQPVLTQLLLKGEKRGAEVQVTSRRPSKRFASEWHPQLPLCVLSCFLRASSTDLLWARCSLSPVSAARESCCPRPLPSSLQKPNLLPLQWKPESSWTWIPDSSRAQLPKELCWDPVRKSAMAGRPRHIQKWFLSSRIFSPPTFPWELIFIYESSDYLLSAGDCWKSIRLKIRLKKKNQVTNSPSEKAYGPPWIL